MAGRILFVLLGSIALLDTSLSTTLAAIEPCLQYDDFFEEASKRYNIPSNLLRAVAIAESDCNQSIPNQNGDGGCGVMQLTGNTRTDAAALLGVSEAALCENASKGARLNILGGTAVLNSYKCWAKPEVINKDDYNSCVSGVGDLALTESQKQQLSQALELWWWPVAQYNGGGLDGLVATTNYPFRVWDKFSGLGITISYPLLSSIRYLHNGDQLPSNPNKQVQYDPTSEFSSSNDDLYPTPSDLGSPGKSGGIRWTNGTFNPFKDVVLHRNDGSVYTSIAGLPCHTFTSISTIPQGFGVPWDVFNPTTLLLKAFCGPTITAQMGPSTYVYHQGYTWDGTKWTQQTFTCTGGAKVSNVWCPNTAEETLPTGTTYYAAYTCNFVNNTWKCGCRDQACTQNLWQLQKIN